MDDDMGGWDPQEHGDITEPMADGVEMIAAERRRQIEAEGYTPEHDDGHPHAMAMAAIAYAQAAIPDEATYAAHNWPWERSAWKPSDDPIRNLVKAGALIAAEIDRLTRAASPVKDEGARSDGK